VVRAERPPTPGSSASSGARRAPWAAERLFDGTMNYPLALGDPPAGSAPWQRAGSALFARGGGAPPPPAGLPGPYQPLVSRLPPPGFLRRCWVVAAGDQPLASLKHCLTAMTPPGPACARRRTGRPGPGRCCSCSCCLGAPASITAPNGPRCGTGTRCPRGHALGRFSPGRRATAAAAAGAGWSALRRSQPACAHLSWPSP